MKMNDVLRRDYIEDHRTHLCHIHQHPLPFLDGLLRPTVRLILDTATNLAVVFLFNFVNKHVSIKGLKSMIYMTFYVETECVHLWMYRPLWMYRQIGHTCFTYTNTPVSHF